MITRFSIVTFIIFVISIVFVIFPFSFHVQLPYFGRRKLSLDLATAPIIAIAILWASQCLGASQIRDGIVGTGDVQPYNILILFFTLAYMAITLDVTGVLQAAAFWVSNKGGSSGRRLYLYFYIMLTVLSVILGNDPVILSGTVFLVYYTSATGLEPTPWLISEFAAANTASMVLFVGNPTNVVICEGFRIQNVAYTAYTILPFLACSVTCYIALMLQFRDEKYIPRKMNVTGHLNPRGVLRDPIGAICGSIILGSCLAVIIIVSFFGVDVWMISLPFAVAKFIFDLCWDHYRFSTGKLDHPTAKEKEKSGEQSGEDESTTGDDPMLSEFKRAMSMPQDGQSQSQRRATFASTNTFTSSTVVPAALTASDNTLTPVGVPSAAAPADKSQNKNSPKLFVEQRQRLKTVHKSLAHHFPTFFTALPRLPFGLVPFAFSQFILIEALEHQGWIEVFAGWLVTATGRSLYPTVWLIGVLGVIMCNVSGTNIGATILLTKVVRAAPDFPPDSTRAAGIALAVASNIGAVSFTFSASLAGLLWKVILEQKGITITQKSFAFWNMLPIIVMTAAGLGVVCAEMAVLY